MITKQSSVKTALEQTGVSVFYFYPASWTQIPVISWRESGNRCVATADGSEYLSELIYTVDIWADSPEETARVGLLADARMTAIGFRRESCADLFESSTRYYRKSIRYRCLADPLGATCQ